MPPESRRSRALPRLGPETQTVVVALLEDVRERVGSTPDLEETIVEGGRVSALGMDARGAGQAPTHAEPTERLSEASGSSKLPRLSLAPSTEPSQTTDRSGPDLAEIRVLGEGGMGRVLLARQRSLGRDVAVKVLHDTATAADASALVREARLAGGLEHPSIVPVHALGTDDDGRPILVMKRIEGVSWRVMLQDPHHPSWEAREAGSDRLAANLEILMQVCRAVEFAHSRGIVHRDIKPDNVMIGTYGEVYLVDWGLAASSGTGGDANRILGTLSYLAPEMALGLAVDERTDVYLLGATLHRMLTGRSRHDRSTVEAAVLAAIESTPFEYCADVPPALATLCNEAMAREPEVRVRSARAFREKLVAFLRGRSAAAICAAACKSLSKLEALLASSPAGEPLADAVAAYGLGSEARFGLRESLAIDPEADEAKRVMRRCLSALVDLELRGGHVEAAELLLADLTPPDPLLAARIAEAKAAAAARRVETDRLRRMVRDRDPTLSQGVRPLVVILLVILVAGLPPLLWIARDPERAPFRLVIAGALALGSSLVVAAVLRKRLETRVNRGLIALFLAVEVITLVNRVLGFVTGSSVSATMRGELILGAGVLAAIAAIALPRMWLGASVSLAGALAIGLRPESTLAIYNVSMFGLVGAFAWAAWSNPAPEGESRTPPG